MIDLNQKEEFCPTRETLLIRVKNQQDEKSWEDFAFYYERFIFIICQKMGLNHHDAQETVQKVLLKLWKKLPEFEYSEGGRFRGWLCTVTGNTVKDFFRKYKSTSEKVEAAKYSDQWNPQKTSQPEINKMMLTEWENHITGLAMEAVQETFSKKVISIFLQFNSGNSAAELSEKYGLPTNTIHQYCRRVKVQFHAEIRRLHHELS